MKFIRRIDDLGRIVIPKDVRRFFGIEMGDPLEITLDKDAIIIKKAKEEDDTVLN